MTQRSDPLHVLVKQLAKLPGIGERTATRLAFHILRAPESYAQQLAEAITEVKKRLQPCQTCGMLTQSQPCHVCADTRRDALLVMVVASPQDVLAVERSGAFRGRYHVLHGLISPLDGIGPNELRIKELLARCDPQQATTPVSEVILATSPSVEGDATAMYLARLLKLLNVAVSRIATGMPIGAELEYADGVTLHRAIEDRRPI